MHDFDDIQALAGDLLLSNCPEVCRKFYPKSVIRELDSIGEDPWRDDHIDRAFEEISILEKNPILAGESASNLGVIRQDLERRLELLRNIRRRYMAFIIDEGSRQLTSSMETPLQTVGGEKNLARRTPTSRHSMATDYMLCW